MRQRDYNPVTGMFLANDPIAVPVGDPFISRYSYGFNNALVFPDASGLFSTCNAAQAFVMGLAGKSCGKKNTGANNTGQFTGGFSQKSKTLAVSSLKSALMMTTPMGRAQVVNSYISAVRKDGWVKGILNASGASGLANDVYMTPVYLSQGNYWAAGSSAANPVWTATLTYESLMLGGAGISFRALAAVECVATSAAAATVTTGGATTIRVLTASEIRAINSLQKRIDEHETKLAEYQADPKANDNKGLLENASSPEIAQSIIDGRIKHLKFEIRTLKEDIRKIREGSGE